MDLFVGWLVHLGSTVGAVLVALAIAEYIKRNHDGGRKE